MGRYRGAQCREDYCTVLGVAVVDTGCTFAVVRLYGCTFLRLYSFVRLSPHPTRLVARTGARTVAFTVYKLERLYRNGCTVLSTRNPHTHTANFIFFVIPRSSMYFLPTDPRGYRTPTFWWEILGEDARTPIPIISNSTETQATIIPLI